MARPCTRQAVCSNLHAFIDVVGRLRGSSYEEAPDVESGTNARAKSEAIARARGERASRARGEKASRGNAVRRALERDEEGDDANDYEAGEVVAAAENMPPGSVSDVPEPSACLALIPTLPSRIAAVEESQLAPPEPGAVHLSRPRLSRGE